MEGVGFCLCLYICEYDSVEIRFFLEFYEMNYVFKSEGRVFSEYYIRLFEVVVEVFMDVGVVF